MGGSAYCVFTGNQRRRGAVRAKVIRKTDCTKDKIKHRFETAFRGKAVKGWQMGNVPSKTYCVRCGAVKR